MITHAVERIAADYDCHAVEGTFSCNMRKFVLEGDKVVLNAKNPAEPPATFKVELDDIYNVDIVMATAGPRMRVEAERPTGACGREGWIGL
jgi:methionyl aminopeptidase